MIGHSPAHDSGTPDDVGEAYGSFAYLVAEKSPLYREIVDIFAEAKSGFFLHLRPSDVHQRLDMRGIQIDGGRETVEAALTQLCQWQVLEAWNDNSDVATLTDFNRRRLQYQLTAAGEAAHDAIRQFVAHLRRRISLDAAALGRIHNNLVELRELTQHEPLDDDRVFQILRSLMADVQDLTARAQSFFRWLHEQTESRRSDLDTFLEYKERLIEYLREFVGELLTCGSRIADVLRSLSQDTERLLATVVAVETRDSWDAADPTGEALREDSRKRWKSRWNGLLHWFLDDAAGPAQSRQLQSAARAAIPRVLALAQQQRLRRGTRSDRAADLRELAAWFLEVEDDRQAHLLWRAAFGLSPARHMTVDPERLEGLEMTPVSEHTTWAESPPVVIDPSLRRYGRQRTTSASRSIVDSTEARRELRRRLVAERQQERVVRQELFDLGKRRFSEIGDLSADSFGLLTDLLGAAADARRPNAATSVGTSHDGGFQIYVEWTQELGMASISTAAGTLKLNDAVFRVAQA